MNDHERFVSCILGKPVDRPPYLLMWGPWGTTWQRWQREGLPPGVTDHRACFGPDACPHVLPVNLGPYPAFDTAAIQQDEQSAVHYDTWGILRRDFRHTESMSEFIRFPVKDRVDWIRYRDARLNPDDPARLAGNWAACGREWMARGYPIQLGDFPDCGVFGTVRWLLGDEDGLIAFRAMPDLVHEIMDHMTSLYLTVFEQVVKEVRVDVIHLWEDMCYRGGPLISPAMWERFMAPCYRRIKAFADRHTIPVISVDTDGDPSLITPAMIAAGVNFLYPMEVAAGCDVNAWQKKHSGLAMLGGIDKRVLTQGPAAIDRELARVRPAVEAGRYIPDLDHLIPDDVSWDNYSYYARALKRMVGAEEGSQ